MIFGKVFKVLIVSGNNAKGALFAKLSKYRLGNGTANLRFGTSSKLVNEDECFVVGVLHHHLHVEQMRRIGAQIIFYALFVANIYHEILKNTHTRSVAHGYRKSTLHHILKQANGFETHRLTTRIWPWNNQDAFILGENNIKRHNPFALFF